MHQGQPNTGTTYGRKNGWGQAGTLRTGDPNGQVTMQAQFDEPGTYTVQFNKQDNGESNNPIFATATITWSVEGHSLTRQVSIADGVSVTGVGQAVRVIMQDATPSLFGAPNAVLYNVSVQCSIGARGNNKQPPILVPGTGSGSAGATGQAGSYDVPAGGSITVPVPSGAGIISLYTTVYVDATVADGELSVTLAYDTFLMKQWDPRDFPDWVPMTPGVNNVILKNISGSDSTWSLTFGIDG